MSSLAIVVVALCAFVAGAVVASGIAIAACVLAFRELKRKGGNA